MKTKSTECGEHGDTDGYRYLGSMVSDRAARCAAAAEAHTKRPANTPPGAPS